MKITIIGGGNIGGAVARGIGSSGFIPAENLTIADISDATLESLAKDIKGVKLTKDTPCSVKDSDIVILAVKPWLAEEVLTSIKDNFDYEKQSLASIVAGVSFDQLRCMLGRGAENMSMFRIIPNTAISLGKSVTFISADKENQCHKSAIMELFSLLGSVFVVPQDQMSYGTSMASCGIAYALRYLKAASEGGVEFGFSDKESLKMVIDTMKGAIALLENNGTQPQTEIDKVTTPGGLTLKGLNAMEESGFDIAVRNGLKASLK